MAAPHRRPLKVSRRAERRVREDLRNRLHALVLRARAPSLADFVAIRLGPKGEPLVALVRVVKHRPVKREIARLLREARWVGAQVWVATVPHGESIRWRQAG